MGSQVWCEFWRGSNDQEANPNPSSDSFSDLNSVSPNNPSINETKDSVSNDNQAGEGAVSKQGEYGSLYPLDRY